MGGDPNHLHLKKNLSPNSVVFFFQDAALLDLLGGSTGHPSAETNCRFGQQEISLNEC